MAGRDERHAPEPPAVPVPELIEEYRVRREAWMAQTDDLVRLRDEVKSSAEREAMDIVTAARRDIRQIVMEARRELLVLSAQVQAALGQAAGPPIVSPAQISAPEEHATADDLSEFVEEEWGFAPRSTVKTVLDQARADMADLVEDARELAVQKPQKSPEPPAPEPVVMQQTIATAVSHVPKAASRVLLSSPYYTLTAGFLARTDSGDLRTGSSLRTFVAFLVAIGVTAVLATLWLMRPPAAAAPSAATPSAATPSAATPPAAAAADAPARSAAPAANPPAAEVREAGGVRISVETLRPAWIRAIVDDRPDAGQTLEAGRVYEFAGNRSIALRIGDAGAVRVSLNGGEARALGRDGQVVNRWFVVDAAPPSPRADAAPPAPQPILQKPESRPTAAAVVPTSVPEVPDFPVGLPPPPVTSAAGASAQGLNASSPAPVTESMLTAAAQQWLDAYHRQDRVALAALSAANLVVIDERPTQERMPPTASSIARTLDRVSVQAAADTAVLTAVMTERVVGGGLQRSSPVSLVWVQTDGTWRLSQVRLVSESRLSQIFR